VNDQLSLQRVYWLLRADVLRNYRSWLITSGSAALVVLVISLLTSYDRDVGDQFYPVFFSLALFALGTLATSDVFVDMHRRGTNTAFLLLPASALEKTLSRLLLTTVGVIVYVVVLTTVLSLVLESINAVAFGVRREFYTPFDGAWPLLPHYLVVQSIFFLGAAWFRKLHYIKTVGATLAIWFGLVSIAVLLAWTLGSELMWGGDGYRVSNFDGPVQGIEVVARAFYYFALPVFCWFVAWLRVTEAQVSHGI
jgi:hypothetical protein